MPKKNSKRIYLVAMVLFLAGIGYLAVTGIASSSAFHVEVADALTMLRDKPDKQQALSLSGAVSAEGLSELEEGIGVRFQVQDHKDPSKRLWAVYEGSVPDLFAPDAPVILEGRYLGPGQDFKVTKLTTLCPSKYEKKLEESRS